MNGSDIRVLIVEDSPADFRLDCELLKGRLNPRFVVEGAGTLAAALTKLPAGADAVLLDLDLPDSRGLETLERVVKRAPGVPIIVLTGINDDALGLEALQRHATDYLPKGELDTWLLVRSIQYAIERKRSESVLQKDKEALSALVSEKADELLRVREEAQTAKRLADIGILAATVAHELRNPLAGIKMAAANIRRKAANPALASHLSTIEKKVQESDQIIGNLLSYSKIKPPHYEVVDVFDLLDATAEEALQRSAGRGLTLRRDIATLKGFRLEADPIQLKEVFTNVLNNSLDALEPGRGEIVVSAAVEGERLKVTIRDNGEGIAPEDIGQVFDPFFTTKAKGTGLGLSVCSQIVRLHGGSIGIKSKKGEGTALAIVLPVKAKRRDGASRP